MFNSHAYVLEWIKTQQPKTFHTNHPSSQYRNLKTDISAQPLPPPLPAGVSVFSSSDTLGLSSSGKLRTAILEEFKYHPRLSEGMYRAQQKFTFDLAAYQDTLQCEVAAFHGAETALLAVNAGLAHLAIFTSLPRLGDAIVYDESISMVTRDCVNYSIAVGKKSFRHNDVNSFVGTLVDLRDSQPLIRSGERSIIIVVEAVYSTSGHVTSLQDLVIAAKTVFPARNYQFIVDETHATGVLGPKGAGLVYALGLEKEIAIRVHSCPSALGSGGATILCGYTTKSILWDNAKDNLLIRTATFPTLAIIRAEYNLLRADTMQKDRDRIASFAILFRNRLSSSPVFKKAHDAHILHIPPWDNDDDSRAQQFASPIIPLLTRPNTQYHLYLALHLQLAGLIVHSVSFPLVPRGMEGVKIVLRASHTEVEVEALAACICSWAEEMLSFEGGGLKGGALPINVQRVRNMTKGGTRILGWV